MNFMNCLKNIRIRKNKELKSMYRKILLTVVTALTLLLSSVDVLGCSEPVFRYALERWQADPYSVVVFYKNKLTEKEQKVVDYYKKFAESNALILLSVVDLNSKNLPKGAEELIKRCGEEKPPFVVVMYPFQVDIKQLAGIFPLDMESAVQLMESPLGRELARRLLKDDSAVFMQIDGEDPKDNEKSASIVLKALKKMNDEFRLPDEPQENDNQEESAVYDENSLRIQFSFLRVSRKNPADKALIETLLNSDEDLKNVKSAIVFPVYGRARALYGFYGPGINAENMEDAARFLTGECSCEIKAQNPGIDMLVPIPWDAFIHYQVNIDDELPPLTGLTSTIVEEKKAEDAPVEKIDLKKMSKVEHSAEKSPLIMNMVIVLISIVFLFAIIALAMKKQKKES